MFCATSTLSTSFQIPACVPSGFVLYAQSVALVIPGSLPNGQNSFGLTTSNGLRSTIRNF